MTRVCAYYCSLIKKVKNAVSITLIFKVIITYIFYVLYYSEIRDTSH